MAGFARGIALWMVAGALTAPLSSVAQSSAPQALVENDHVRITRTELGKDATLAGTPYDEVAIQLQDGEIQLLERGHVPKVQYSKAGEFQYFVAGSRRSLMNVSKQPVSFIVVQFLRPPGKYEAMDVTRSHYCNADAPKSCVTEQYSFCTERFCAETVTLDPGAISTQHTHDSDHILIATAPFKWREEAVGKAPEEHSFALGDTRYIEAGITHRFINVGTTTARMFVIQYK